MKIFNNKFLIKLIVSLCLFLTLISFGAPSKVRAENDQIWGGKLLSPVIDLLTTIGDAIMEILHDSIQAQDAALIQINSDSGVWDLMKNIGAVIIGIVVAVAAVAVVLATAGGAAAAAAALAGGAVKSAFIMGAVGAIGNALTVGVIAGVAVSSGLIPNDIYLPAFSISPEEIFKNEIALFDVNFFNPNKYTRQQGTYTSVDSSSNELTLWNALTGKIDDEYKSIRTAYNSYVGKTITVSQAKTVGYGKFIEKINSKLPEDKKIKDTMRFEIKEKQLNKSDIDTDNGIMTNEVIETYWFSVFEEGESSSYLQLVYKFATITKVNISTGGSVEDYTYIDDIGYKYEGSENNAETSSSDNQGNTNTVEVLSTAAQLQGVVSTWYFILRNIALLVLMLVLVYTGIRIVIGSTAGEKAKYKERLTDWIVAMCLIFIMHYIMVFAIELVEKFVDIISTTTANGNLGYIVLTEEQETNAEKVLTEYDTIGEAFNKNGQQGVGAIAYKDEKGNAIGDGHGVLMWPTDLAGLFRIEAQITEAGTVQWVGYSLCYVVLVLFTLFFAYTYARRVLYVAFLTMIAPLVAMTYPIDKMTDGKAQAFDSWLKEYIFNLMIQPLHLLLYTILVSSAYSLASNSPIYALVAVGFMIPAEKLMRRFFGYEKAKTPGFLGGAAGAALTMTGLQKIMGHRSKGGNSSSSNNTKSDTSKTRLHDPNASSIEDDYNIADSKYDDIKLKDDKKDNKEDSFSKDNEFSDEKPSAGQGRKINPEKSSDNGPGTPVRLRDTTPEEKDRISKEQEAEKQEWEKVQEQRNARKAAEQKAAQEAAQKAAQEANAERIKQEKQKNWFQRKKDKFDNSQAGRVSKAVASQYKKDFAGKVYKRVQKRNPVNAMVDGAAGLAGGALFGAAGLALGVASGDPSKAFQYTSAGAIGGAKVASNTSKAIGNALAPENPRAMADTIERAWYGDDYQKVKRQEAINEQYDTTENENKWKDNEEEFNMDTISEYVEKYKIDDSDEQILIEKYSNKQADDALEARKLEAEEQGETLSIEQETEIREKAREKAKKDAIQATKWRKNLPSKMKNMSDKKKQEYRETLEKQMLGRLVKEYPEAKENQKTMERLKKMAYQGSVDRMNLAESLEKQKSTII